VNTIRLRLYDYPVCYLSDFFSFEGVEEGREKAVHPTFYRGVRFSYLFDGGV